MNSTHIVIIGGGYSGVMAARRLAQKTHGQPVQITLVNGSDHFVERIRLHQVAANQGSRTISLRNLLDHTGIGLVQGWVTKISPESCSLTVQTTMGQQTIAYDYLINALGSFVDTARVPGAADYALSVSTEETTLELRERLPGIAARGGRLVVCGGGLTGIELATELAEAYPGLKVSLLTRDQFGEQLSKRGSGYLRRTFDRLHIDIIDNATITRITPDHVEYQGGTAAYDLCLYAAGFAVPTLAREAGLTVNAQGQVIVDDHLRSVSHPEIYTVGDAADVSDAINTPIRMACATALPMGAYAADDLAAKLQGKSHRPHEFVYGGRCISLGRHAGLMQLVDAEDNPKEQIITGWLGAQIKEIICRYTVWQIRHARWMYYPRRPAAKRKAAHVVNFG
ncbi:MAG: FAD-dependent oxidoreductase [Chloroflexota bacterium]